MPIPRIAGTVKGLSPTDVERVNGLMNKIVRAFDTADPVALQETEHSGGDPRGAENTFDFNKSLMDGGDKVRSWSACPYSEPDWEIMKDLRFQPHPTIWIEITLHDGKREYPLAFACAADEKGVLRSCYYAER